MRALAAAVALGFAGPAAGQGVLLPVPSGLEVEAIEVIFDDDLALGRFRFLAPAIAAPGFEMRSLRADFDLLCRDVALPRMRAERPDWDEVVISLSSVAIPFGETDPEVAQAFEAYNLEGENCIWIRF